MKCLGIIIMIGGYVRGKATYQCSKCGKVYYQYRKYCNAKIEG